MRTRRLLASLSALLLGTCLVITGCTALDTAGTPVAEPAASEAGPSAGSSADPSAGSGSGESGSGASTAAPTLSAAGQAALSTLCGGVDHQRTLVHPYLGSVGIALSSEGGLRGCIGVVDAAGRTLMRQAVMSDRSSLKFAEPATDATNNVFVGYNPGRYNGVITLVPNSSGYENIGWGERGGSETTTHAYYSAEWVGPGSDGRYTINTFANNCEPSCAAGTVTTTELKWNGRTYTPQICLSDNTIGTVRPGTSTRSTIPRHSTSDLGRSGRWRAHCTRRLPAHRASRRTSTARRTYR